MPSCAEKILGAVSTEKNKAVEKRKFHSWPCLSSLEKKCNAHFNIYVLRRGPGLLGLMGGNEARTIEGHSGQLPFKPIVHVL